MGVLAKQERKKRPSVVSSLLENYKIWVLFPYLETDDPNLQHYYDFTQSLEEYKRVFSAFNADWIWQPVTMKSYAKVVASIRKQTGDKTPLVLNLCDGDEINGTPGVSVIHELEKHQLIYTGSNAFFYDITTSKIPMKKAFDEAGVAHAKWEVINTEEAVKGVFERIGSPLIIKPAISGGSMGVSVKNVVNNEQQLYDRLQQINNGYRGWDLSTGGLFVEQFIAGPEFTSMIVGSSDHPDRCVIYEPVERVFHPSLPENEKFLSFDRLWEIYEEETPMPNNGNFYEYFPVDAKMIKKIKKLSLDAYCALKGQGYARIDIRMDAASRKLYTLEVNAQCGISEDEDYTSIGAILRISGKSFAELVLEILNDALVRNKIIA
jgi:D-alanine-D-alanine ligase